MKHRCIWILSDQLCRTHPALAAGDRDNDVVFMVESRTTGAPLKFHKQKLVLLFSAMRHHAAWLRSEGWTVFYLELSDAPNFESGLNELMRHHRVDEVVLMEPNSFAETREIHTALESLNLKVSMLPSAQFLVPRSEFSEWAAGKKRLLMENHYRRIRQTLDVLVEPNGEPIGGQWNFDAENRKTISQWKAAGPPPPPAPPSGSRDPATQAVIDAVETHFTGHPGDAHAFWLPATREESLEWLNQFVKTRLARFGDFQDLMVTKERTMFHSLLSPMINIGLLLPMECVSAAVDAYKSGDAPLAAVEGFVRQILGWREFVNGVYWLKMPDYAAVNSLDAQRALPEFFYTGDTDLRCLSESLHQVIETGYNHHIQRLMIIGNFLLLAGIRPQEALAWFTEMYVDAYDWVMAANVLGMALHADGGFMATKPYAGAASYISKMSDYCAGCKFKPTVKFGPSACPFNLLYWAFYDRHQDRFGRNPRTSMMVKSWQKRAPDEQKKILAESAEFLESL